MSNLPLYKINIDPKHAEEGAELGIEMVAFVKSPAVMVKGVAFDSQESKTMLFSDNVKMRIAAPIMIPMNIYRFDDWGEYYVQFTREEIETLYSKFMKARPKSVFNMDHDVEQVVPAYILESWIIGDDNLADRSYSEFGVECPPGSVFMVAQVTDREVFDDLVISGRTGFSIEGLLGLDLISHISAHNAQQSFTETKTTTKMLENFTFTGEAIINGQKVQFENGIPVSQALAEPVPTDQAPAAPAESAPAMDPQTIMDVVSPKLEEIYTMIAEIKTALDTLIASEMDTTEDVPQEMSIAERFASISKFLSE